MATREHEEGLRAHGVINIVGVDEAGRGCLAGPLAVGACYLPIEFKVQGVNDSKKITSEKKRQRLYNEIVSHPGVVWDVQIIQPAEIDRTNILAATLKGMKKAANAVLRKLGGTVENSYVCIDGNRAPHGLSWSHETVVGGDGKYMNIAAASILAKVTRDNIMIAADAEYPGWGFAKHKGYGAKTHMDKIKNEHQWTPLHRLTFAPVKHLVGK
jgi:ribonuclease HII